MVFTAAVLLRVVFLFYGLWQDANSAFKYTDIDYYVFTDASRYMAHGRSPYERETYRYTPLLAWLLLPTTWSSIWFSFGKVIFAVADIITGWLILVVLRAEMKISMDQALKFASIWLLNPMVATISTRGSSEGLLGVMVLTLLWAVTQHHFTVAGALLGLGVHFKIYPFIYAPTIIWWLDDEHLSLSHPEAPPDEPSVVFKAKNFFNSARLKLTFTSLAVFAGLNVYMYIMYVQLFDIKGSNNANILRRYGWPFLQHTYLHHVTRVDHRHNFSPYNALLYLSSSGSNTASLHFESVAFFPQLLLSAVVIPLLLAKKDLPSTMLASTWAFTCFNKVCTSQVSWPVSFYHLCFVLRCSSIFYGIWYFCPFIYLDHLSWPIHALGFSLSAYGSRHKLCGYNRVTILNS